MRRYASPLVGEGWGGGWRVLRRQVPYLSTPTPNPSPQGGGEQAEHAACVDQKLGQA
jgi:hypothetical protein